jgi:hypothetical protein
LERKPKPKGLSLHFRVSACLANGVSWLVNSHYSENFLSLYHFGYRLGTKAKFPGSFSVVSSSGCSPFRYRLGTKAKVLGKDQVPEGTRLCSRVCCIVANSCASQKSWGLRALFLSDPVILSLFSGKATSQTQGKITLCYTAFCAL